MFIFMSGLIASLDKFVQLLHDTIKAGLADGVDDVWKAGAMALQSGWMHIHGERITVWYISFFVF